MGLRNGFRWSVKPPLGTQVDYERIRHLSLESSFLLNEGGGNRLMDSVSPRFIVGGAINRNAGFTGTTGTPTWTVADGGPALSYVGANAQYNSLNIQAASGSLGCVATGKAAFSIEAWARPSTSSSTSMTLYSEGNTGSTNQFLSLRIGDSVTTGVLSLALRQDDAAQLFNLTSTPTFNDGKLHHFVATYTGGNTGTAAIYADGRQLGTITGAFTGTITFNAASIGALVRSTVSAGFDGVIEEVHRAVVAWNAATVAERYANRWLQYRAPAVRRFYVVASALAAGVASFVSSGPAGISVSASDAAGGTAPYTYQWQRSVDGGTFANLSGATARTLTDATAASGHLYGYQLAYTDAASATATSNAITAAVYTGGAISGAGGPTSIYRLGRIRA